MEKRRIPLDMYEYDLMPPAMKAYLRNYGFTFSKKAFEYAVSLMERVNPTTGETVKMDVWDKERVEECFKKNNVSLKGNLSYDHVYVFNMALSDYPKSLPNDTVRCLFVKETLEDIDASPDNVFRKWIVSIDSRGIPIYWEDLL